jgi:hypothetical protein
MPSAQQYDPLRSGALPFYRKIIIGKNQIAGAALQLPQTWPSSVLLVCGGVLSHFGGALRLYR